jgi:hypothetical protein
MVENQLAITGYTSHIRSGFWDRWAIAFASALFSRMLEEGSNSGYYDDCHGEQC